MILVNFPHLIGWFIFYFATSVPMLYVSSVIMGLGIGFMEAPIITYVGEISQPEMRGILTSYSGKAAICRSHYFNTCKGKGKDSPYNRPRRPRG